MGVLVGFSVGWAVAVGVIGVEVACAAGVVHEDKIRPAQIKQDMILSIAVFIVFSFLRNECAQ